MNYLFSTHTKIKVIYIISYLFCLVYFAIIKALGDLHQELIWFYIIEIQRERSEWGSLLDGLHCKIVGELVLWPAAGTLHDQPPCARLPLGLSTVQGLQAHLSRNKYLRGLHKNTIIILIMNFNMLNLWFFH